jgi:hypothetical protein
VLVSHAGDAVRTECESSDELPTARVVSRQVAGDGDAAVLRTPETFRLADARGEVVHQGPFGQSVRLAEGHYTFTTSFAGRQFSESLWVNTGATTAVLFDAGKVDVTPGAKAPVRTTGDAETRGGDTGAAAPRFCTECGSPIGAGARFCTSCGKRVGG